MVSNPEAARVSKIFRHQAIIKSDPMSDKLDVCDNKTFKQINLRSVFSKTGEFIFSLGVVNLHEYLLMNLMLALYCSRT